MKVPLRVREGGVPGGGLCIPSSVSVWSPASVVVFLTSTSLGGVFERGGLSSSARRAAAFREFNFRFLA